MKNLAILFSFLLLTSCGAKTEESPADADVNENTHVEEVTE